MVRYARVSIVSLWILNKEMPTKHMPRAGAHLLEWLLDRKMLALIIQDLPSLQMCSLLLLNMEVLYRWFDIANCSRK